MFVVSLIAATMVMVQSNQQEGFLVPSLERDRIELHHVKRGEEPRLVWQRKNTLPVIEDDQGIKGTQWVASNLLVTVSPDHRRVFIPCVQYKSGTLELGGTILESSGVQRELSRTSMTSDDDLTLYYGWNEMHPSIVKEEGDFQRKAYTYRNEKWEMSATIPESFQSLDGPSSFLGSMISGTIMFSDSWQCSMLPTRYMTTENLVVLGSRVGMLAASSHKEIMIIDQGTVRSSSAFTATENILPLDGGRVVGRIIRSNEPRATFSGLWTAQIDPFIDSEVFIFDLKSGTNEFLSKGFYALPVDGAWNPAK